MSCVFVCVCVCLPLLFNAFARFVFDVSCDVVWCVFLCVAYVCVVLSVFVWFVCDVCCDGVWVVLCVL